MTDEQEKAPKFLTGLRAVLIVIVAIFTIIAIITIFQNKRDARPFNTFTFPETVMVENGTHYAKADTMCMVLAQKVFGLDTFDLKIYYIPDVVQEGDMEWSGFIQQLPFGEHKYLLLLNKDLSFSKLKETIAHEFAHVYQYERGFLQIFGDTYTWDGEEYHVSDHSYEDRPFEVHARDWDGVWLEMLEEELYDEI